MSLILDLPAFPFYEAESTVSADIVPGRYPVALAGRPYMVDTRNEDFLHRTIPMLRSQQDTRDEPSEASLNPEGLWRRGQHTWHHGAGQDYLDHPESDPARFRASKGIDPWTEGEISLLWDTRSIRTSVNSNLQLAVAGDRLYLIDGSSVLWTDDISGTPTWNTVTGTPASTPVSITSDGYNVLTAHGASGLYRTTRASSSAGPYANGNASLVAWVKDRVMVAAGSSLFNVVAPYPGPAALPASHYQHRNSDFTWVGFCEGNRVVYAAGYSGDKSLVFRIPLLAGATGLDAPSVAVSLPDGEIVRSIFSYLGFVFIGTDKGLRFATQDGEGYLTVGALIETPNAVRCFEGQGHHVWFGMTNYDGSSTGLGRAAPEAIDPDDFAPAWASDLMASGQGEVTSVVTFGDLRVFAVSGVGVFVENRAQRVASGTLDTGLITYGLPDEKVAVFLDTRYRVLEGSHRAWIAQENAAFTAVGIRTEGGDLSQFTVGQLRSESFELREELIRDSTDPTLGPVLTRHTLKAEVAADVGSHIFVPILLHETCNDLNGVPVTFDVAHELELLDDMRGTRTVVVYQEGTRSFVVTVEDVQFRPHHLTQDRSTYNGVASLKLKKVV